MDGPGGLEAQDIQGFLEVQEKSEQYPHSKVQVVDFVGRVVQRREFDENEEADLLWD